MTPEGDVKKRVKEMLERYGILPFKTALAVLKEGNEHTRIHGYYSMPSASGYGEAGIGDFLLCIQAMYMEIETKAKKGKLRGIQDAHISVVTAAGGYNLVIKTEDDMNTLENILMKSHATFKTSVVMIENQRKVLAAHRAGLH